MSADRDRGAISVAMLLLLVVVFAGAGLVTDGGRTMAARRHASNTAEAAARAAVATATPVSFDPVAARRAALAHAQRAGVRAADVVVEVRGDAVRVTITERRSTVFLILGGRSTLTVRETGIARIVYSD